MIQKIKNNILCINAYYAIRIRYWFLIYIYNCMYCLLYLKLEIINLNKDDGYNNYN
jgi:hypothetical protein